MSSYASSSRIAEWLNTTLLNICMLILSDQSHYMYNSNQHSSGPSTCMHACIVVQPMRAYNSLCSNDRKYISLTIVAQYGAL